ncbi:MAG: 30S ribosomal protein S8, partial [Clostridia bacterium]|nr:30S ribosomal protein S8 [Clostridia bacterium]
DPISDMLVTIRNGLKARLVQVSTPASNMKSEIARVCKAHPLKDESSDPRRADEPPRY